MNQEYITTCTQSQVFDRTKSGADNVETIKVKTIVINVKLNRDTTGYTFKIKDGDGIERWTYYDWFLVLNTPKNVSIIDEIERISKKISNLQEKQEELRESYEHQIN